MTITCSAEAREKVDRLRMKLGQKAKREPKFKFYTLYGHICREDVLLVAWEAVRKNAGASGVDNVSIQDVEQDVEGFINDIQKSLVNRTYKPMPVKRVFIPKPNGKLRPLGIPTVKDRVVQQAVKLVLEPIFEEDFLDCSYGFRPNRSAHDGLEKVKEALRTGKNTVYDVDLAGYFDTIPHEKVMKCLEMRVSDRRILSLIWKWLKAPIHESSDKHERGYKIIYPKSGTPQGGVISPLLANIYLHWLDVRFHQVDGPANWAKAQLVRYADDFVIIAKYQSKKLIRYVEDIIEGWLELTINCEKTKLVDLRRGDALDFLGYTFRYDKDLKGRGHKYLNMHPSKKAVKKERMAIKEMTSVKYNFVPIHQLIGRMNRQIKGWAEYFSRGYPRKAYRQINWYAQERLVKHLGKRSQRRYRPPEGVSYYEHLQELGLVYL